MAAIIATKLALIEAPPVAVLAAANPAWSPVDWARISSGTLTVFLFDMVTFADAWAAIEQRWTDGDYSVRPRPVPVSVAPLCHVCALLSCSQPGSAGCLTTGDATDQPQP
jgi:hypothetical protein